MPTWSQVLKEIHATNQKANEAAKGALDTVRHKYLNQLHNHTKRNVIAYYSGFLSKPNVTHSEINHEDLNGLMQAVHNLDRKAGLDLVLHTQGGQVSAAISIVHYLRQMFDRDIRAVVPQIAMSAGTMIACSCKEIVLAKHSQLGPTDPHLKNIPAAGVKKEFLRACREIKKYPERVAMWQKIIGQYRPTFLSQCENAMKLSKSFVEQQLAEVMFENDSKAEDKAKKVVKALTDYSGNKAHDRPIHVDECSAMGLRVVPLEADSKLQDLVLTVHHNYMHIFMNGPAYKLIENHLGSAIIKNIVKG